MEYKKKVESFIRAILYPESTISIVCKDEGESRKCFKELQYMIEQYDILKPEIESDSDCVIRFKNGSNISVLKPNEFID